MNGENGPLSPVSIGGSGWSSNSKYSNADSYHPNHRQRLISPPSSITGAMNGGGFTLAGPPSRGSNGPSPPSSIARSSNGASLYNGTTLYAGSDAGGRSRNEQQLEAILSEHYMSLKRYLAASLRDDKGNPRPNKARDKLLRLSYVQFQELSTDVYDELSRRQQTGMQQSNASGSINEAPSYLLPKDTFHPKRNQARQKLSTLPPPRFRDLATDVFYELERRFPRFAGGDISRMDSPASMRGPPSRSGNGTPIDPMMRPGSRNGPGLRMRRPSEASSVTSSQYPRSDSRNGAMNGFGPGSPGISPNDYGRPLAKTMQSNTIVPNKSTMVEDSDAADEDEDEDNFGLESAARSVRDSKKSQGSESDKKLIAEYQSQVAELKDKMSALEESLRLKDEALSVALDGERASSSKANVTAKEFADLRLKLEGQLADAKDLNQRMDTELERARAEHQNSERDLVSQLDALRLAGSSRDADDELQRENDELRAELREQQEVTNEVRQEAQDFLREMRLLTERSGSSWEREEQLVQQVTSLEAEVRDWRNRYARTKTQLRSLRASSIGLTIQQDAAKYAKDSGFTQEDGLVKDVNVTKFQISVDELLRTARTEMPEKVVDYMKAVVVAVRNITQDIDSSATNQPSPLQSKLKGRVSATANNLITASKNFAAAKGVSPVSLLDAAASHLTTAIVELVKTVKIRPTPAGELEDDDDGVLPTSDPTGFFQSRDEENTRPFLGLGRRQSNASSMYSAVTDPRISQARPRSSGRWTRPISRGSVNGSEKMPALTGGWIAGGVDAGRNREVEELKVSVLVTSFPGLTI